MVNRQYGIYYTALFNPFEGAAFQEWARSHRLERNRVLEPFAGRNSIIEMLRAIGMASSYSSYDLHPGSWDVKRRDTFADYPTGHDLCVTNPPWLYKSSARRRGLDFPDTAYDDLYKHSLSLCLEHSGYVAALVPASFAQSGLFLGRLERLAFLNRPLFEFTENPVCLAMFSPEYSDDVLMYNDDDLVGTYHGLRSHIPKASSEAVFNDPCGELGFIAIDNNAEASIRFCLGKELCKHRVGHSSRAITRVGGVGGSKKLVDLLNDKVYYTRSKTFDVFLTAFKGLRKDGKYRRRMDYHMARNIIGDCDV